MKMISTVLRVRAYLLIKWTKFWSYHWENKRKGLPPRKIVIKTISHRMQRYNTVGDYYYTCWGTMLILVSKLGDNRYEQLVYTHELTESDLCRRNGITIRMIDKFDFAFTASRDPSDASEPGDDPAAPYYHQHQFATIAEKAMATQLGVDWDEYEARIAEVMKTYP